MMRQGDHVYRSSHLLELGVVSQGITTCKIEGFCIQSSHPLDPPHTITIDTRDNFSQWKFHCTCKAGNGGRCKHIYAALLHINIQKKLQIITCTQRAKYWGKVFKAVAETILEPELISNLEEFQHFHSQKFDVTQEEYTDFHDIYCSDSNSAMAIFLHRHNSAKESITDSCINTDTFDEDEKYLREFLKNLFTKTDFRLNQFTFRDFVQNLVNFYTKRICISCEACVELNIKTRDQKNDLWRSGRKFRFTASECYQLYTASKSPNVDWKKKIELYFKSKPNLINFSIGRREEPNAVRLYEIKKKQKVTKIGLIVHPTLPWLGCSPDGIVFQTNTVIEVKTLINKKNEPFDVALTHVQYLGVKEGRLFLRKKHVYYGQVQINMHLLCLTKAHLIIHNYNSQEISVVTVDYDEEFALELIHSLKAVYFNHALPYIYENFTTETDKKKYEN